MKDEIISELRKIRDAHAAKFNYDIDAMARDLKKGERGARHKLVNLKPRRVTKR